MSERDGIGRAAHEARVDDLGNRRKILDAIRIGGKMARIEIADTTGLSPATVSAVTNALLLDGYLEQSPSEGDGVARRGRPKVDLQLRAEAAFVAGVKISMHRIAVSITDFVGAVLGANSMIVRTDRQPPEHIAELVDDALTAALDTVGLERSALAGVGLGAPGFIDGATGLCHWSPIFGAQPLNLAALFSRKLGLPCFVDNDSNLATLAQHWFGAGKGLSDLVVVTIEQGVGMGAIIGSRLYRGASGVSSEFGHTKVRPGGALCRCGQRGCIEAYLADYAILREVGSFRADVMVDDPIASEAAILRVLEDGRNGDPQIREIYERAGWILGLGLANVINILAPELLLISGDGARAADLFEPSMREALFQNTVTAAIDRTAVEVVAVSDSAWAHGAAALVLAQSTFGGS